MSRVRQLVHDYVRRLALWLLAWVDADTADMSHECQTCHQMLSRKAIRTHDGWWLCREHKVEHMAVTHG